MSTVFLRAVILLIGAIVLALSIFALPNMWQGQPTEIPLVSHAVFLIMIGLYATTVPYFIALWQGMKLLTLIDRNKAFSAASVLALRNIKHCAVIIAVLYVGGIPLLYPIAELEDAPGLILIGAAFACAPVAVAVFASLVEKLLQSAIEFKTENDLTV